MQQSVDDFFHEIRVLAKKQHAFAWLVKSRKINSLTVIILMIWLLILHLLIVPIDTSTDPGKRDLMEALLEVGEKLFAFIAITTKTYCWRLATFGFVTGFSIVMKGLEVHFDPAPTCVAGPNWAFAKALTARAFKHIAYTVRLTPATKAWESLVLEAIRELRHLSTKQFGLKSMWAASHYQQYLLDHQQLRIKIEKGPRARNP